MMCSFAVFGVLALLAAIFVLVDFRPHCPRCGARHGANLGGLEHERRCDGCGLVFRREPGHLG